MGVKSTFRQFAQTSWQSGLAALESVLYPPKCLLCGLYMEPAAENSNALESCFCDTCLESGSDPGLNPIHVPYCVKCGIQLPGSHLENHVCGTCLEKPLIPEKIRASFEYKGVIKEAIPLFKYHSKLALAKPLEQVLFQTFLIHFQNSAIDLIIPIPLHLSKLKQRGFNQTYLLVRNFEKYFFDQFITEPPWTVDIHSLERKKKTETQTGFDVDHREQNLKNAFKLLDENAVKNKSILLIDDVFTTGATCNEAARLLLKHGARKVQALVLARA